MTRWLALTLSAAMLFLAAWIWVPAPTYFLLTFSVGAPEVSAWLMAGSVTAALLALPGISHSPVSPVSRIALACACVALLLSASPFARLRSTVRRFDAEMRDLSAMPRSPRRAKPLVIADLFRGIPTGTARVETRIPFAAPGGVQLTLDVYRPPEPGHYPIVVQIYGGAWQRGEPESNSDFARWLAASGYVVVAVDYRHAPRWRWPAQLEDIDTSLAWIRDHAVELDGDTSRVVLMGRSAGAHLAMTAAYRSPPLRVRGVVSYYGPAFLADAYANPPHPDPLRIRAVEEALVGGPLHAMPERYADASPISFLTHPQPPTLLIYGGRDHVVEARYGLLLRERIASSQTPVAYLEIPWADHAFDAVFNGPSSQLALYYTERFIAWAVR